MAITHISQLDLNGVYTFADYMSWQIQERLELLRGKIALMSPVPSVYHQKIVSRLHVYIGHFLLEHPCQTFVAPFDVRLYTQDRDTIVQPDICVVCDESKLDKQVCNGAPDLVVEVLSPGNTRHEMREKFNLYEEAGVQAYWLVNPSDPSLLRYLLNQEGIFIGKQPLTDEDKLTTALFPGLEIELAKIFD